LSLFIGGIEYRLRPVADPPPGFTIWTLRKQDPDAPSSTYAVAKRGREIKCTCPDHTQRNAHCKHIMSLMALGLIRGRKPSEPKPRPVTRAVARRAKAICAEVNAMSDAARRQLASEATISPASRPLDEMMPLPQRTASAIAPPPPRQIAPAPEGSFTHGFRQAINDYFRSRREEVSS
jgi:hypothetical protein